MILGPDDAQWDRSTAPRMFPWQGKRMSGVGRGPVTEGR
jgi:hypothetical protein